MQLFSDKKQELDCKINEEEEIQNKLKGLKIDNLFDEFFDDMRWTNSLLIRRKRNRKFQFDQLDKETGKLASNLGGVDVEKEMQKSVLKPGLEKEHTLPKYNISDKELRATRKVFYLSSHIFLTYVKF